MKSLLIAAILIMGVSMMIVLIGALFKLEHLPGASTMLAAGLLGKAAGILLLMIYFVRQVRMNKLL